MKVRMTSGDIVDFLAVESYLNGFGHKKLTRILREKSINLSESTVRRLKNERRKELEDWIRDAIRQVKERRRGLTSGKAQDLETLHTKATLRIIDVFVCNLPFELRHTFYEFFMLASGVTVKAMFDLYQSFGRIVRNVELVDAFRHHVEISEMRTMGDKLRQDFDTIVDGFRMLMGVSVDIRDRSYVEKAVATLTDLYETATRVVNDVLHWDLDETTYFFTQVAGMLGPDEDYLSWSKHQGEGSEEG